MACFITIGCHFIESQLLARGVSFYKRSFLVVFNHVWGSVYSVAINCMYRGEWCVKICHFLVKIGRCLVSGWSVVGDTLWLRTFYTLFLHKFHTFLALFRGGSAWVYISGGSKNRQNLTTHF